MSKSGTVPGIEARDTHIAKRALSCMLALKRAAQEAEERHAAAIYAACADYRNSARNPVHWLAARSHYIGRG